MPRTERNHPAPVSVPYLIPRDEERGGTPLSALATPEAENPSRTSTRSPLEDRLFRMKILLTRFVKQKLAHGTQLTEVDLNQLSALLNQCTKFAQSAKPLIDEYDIPRRLNKLLKFSASLPDFMGPRINMIIEAWARDEYNPDSDSDSDSEDDTSPESEDELSQEEDSDDDIVPSRAGTAMRGIIVERGEQRLVYKIDERAKRPADVFGHNGLRVGAWWPLQICAVRDGAHGAVMGGIYGKRDKGAYSIVVAGGSGYDDRDLGDVLWYSGSGRPGADQTLTHVNRAMLRSIETKKPVRVLRRSRSDSRFAPSAGLRYDGLYKVTASRLDRGRDGFQVYRFKLERLPNQADIRREVPTAEELRTLRGT